MGKNRVFKWESPPKRRSGRNAEAYQIAKRVATKPNEWAKIALYKTYQAAATRATRIRAGEIQAWSDVGTFEAKVRQTDKNEYSLYVRCVYVKKGDDDESQPVMD